MSIGALPNPRVTFHNRGFRRGAGDTLQPEDTMADNDFVERLRIRWETMGDMANDERAAAAAEIESLRYGQREMMRTIAMLTTERDEARREVCRDSACRLEKLRIDLGPPQIAKIRGWDCFKEDGNG